MAFNERMVLIVALVIMFAIQLIIAGSQVVSCKRTPQSADGKDPCFTLDENLFKASDSASKVFLALLVPAAAAGAAARNSRSKGRKDGGDGESGGIGSGKG